MASINPLRRLRALLVAGVALAAVACATVDSTPDAPLVPGGERTTAGQQHPQILAQFGGAVQGPSAVMVSRVGEKIAVAAGVPGQCTFSVVNSEVPNAFAVPGCYIYITRGLLALMNSEDELASVLGHEVGHVVADHAAKRQNTATMAGLGALVAGVLTGSGQVAQAASQAAQLYALNYSRDQEFEADDLGVRYLARSGYNPYAASDMLGTLGAQDALSAKINHRDAASAIPAWARTHPLSADRVTRSLAQAQAAGGVRGGPPELTGPYLQAVRGLTYGDDREQGFVNGRTFLHPVLKLAFDAPEGFTLTNTTSAVQIGGGNGRAQLSGGALPQGGIEAQASSVLQQILGQAPAQVGQLQRTTINGLQAATISARAQTQSGQVVDVGVTSYRFGERGYYFATMAPAGGSGVFAPMIRSMRALSDQEAAALRERQIDIVSVTSRDTAEGLARRMAFSDYQLERFLVLNGRTAGQPLRAGDLVKIVRYAP
jgi:predicted Zn-dependent protease